MGKIKDHFTNHKELYIGIGIGAVVVGSAAILYFGKCPIGTHVSRVSSGRDTLINSTIVHFVERSTPSKPVHLVGTNLYFDSMSQAARETGHSVSRISQNVRGLIDNVNGDVFELLELAV